MNTSHVATSLLIVLLVGISIGGGQTAQGQRVQVEMGGGWAIPSSSVDMTGTTISDVDTLDGIPIGPLSVDAQSGWHGYGSFGLQWELSSNFNLEMRFRGQRVRVRGDSKDITSSLVPCVEESCTVTNEPDGQILTGTVEGRLVLTSTGRIKPYFLVGLGIVYTAVDGVLVEEVKIPRNDGSGTSEELEIDFSDVSVTDAGGDVGFGAYFRLVGGLTLVGEMRATGSLPGAKENAITTFPFTLGLAYKF